MKNIIRNFTAACVLKFYFERLVNVIRKNMLIIQLIIFIKKVTNNVSKCGLVQWLSFTNQ